MTATPRSPRLLLITTLVLAVAGGALLTMPHGQDAKVSQQPPSATASTFPYSHASPAPRGARERTGSAATAPSSHEAALPPHGEGPAGDPAIQQVLERAWPADLPADDERQLLTAGQSLLRADATGIGRAQWPGVFSGSGQAVAPAFATARFRIQAAIARRDGSPSMAVVHLVWAGTDRGGTYTDGRITDLFFTRTTKKGKPTWTPQPRI
ncbi:hypothetical protein ACM01_15175 [Streptomyces viridochromogenes]|uniref:Uncharacterized protein n=1 Tax=Streptomyces viridochromogenes TaxID=1938 RepID=A0A0J7ZEI5_STRVR|nr:hypothetical protein [Streptomyces viridochromogenes]KMS74249.1 hypothetical protein ACM01_15175 [Streptomyces viridochromogenes]